MTCAVFFFNILSTYFIRQFLVLVLLVGFCFDGIMCVWDSYVYPKLLLLFIIETFLLYFLNPEKNVQQ